MEELNTEKRPQPARLGCNFKGGLGAREGVFTWPECVCACPCVSAPSRVVKPKRKTGVKVLLTGSPETCLQ